MKNRILLFLILSIFIASFCVLFGVWINVNFFVGKGYRLWAIPLLSAGAKVTLAFFIAKRELVVKRTFFLIFICVILFLIELFIILFVLLNFYGS